jgi:hypothetical protein
MQELFYAEFCSASLLILFPTASNDIDEADIWAVIVFLFVLTTALVRDGPEDDTFTNSLGNRGAAFRA